MVRERKNTVERRKKIMSLLSEKDMIYVPKLSDLFNVSEVTIRNDLEQLEKKGMLIRARGGAIKIETGRYSDAKQTEKSRSNYLEKSKIGKAAVNLIHDYETIIIDSGSTTYEVTKNIVDFKELTIITNALNIANELQTKTNVNAILLGGYLRHTSMSIVGPIAQNNIKLLSVDKAFIGVDGFDSRKGIYAPNIEEAYLKELMVDTAKEVIVVTDSSKFKKRSLAYVCPPSMINTVVTDKKIMVEDRKILEDHGIKVIMV